MTAEQAGWLPAEPVVPRETPPPASIQFTVRGLPVPKGSMTRGKFGGVYPTNAKKLGAWQSAIAGEAQGAMRGREVLRSPVSIDVTFVLPRPKAHFLPANARRPVAIRRADAPHWHAGDPDIDKLERALFDALTNVVLADDNQVVEVVARKAYELPDAGLNVGAVVCVVELR